MSWSKLAPISKTAGRPMASAGIAVNKDGVAKVSLFLAASLVEEFGDPDKVDVSAGEGEHEGSLLIEFNPKGAFDLKKGVGGSKRIFVPLPTGCPDKPAAVEACTLGEKAAKSVVVVLPVARWTEAIAARLNRPAAHETRTPPQEPAAPKANGGALDMVEYLKGKGVKIERLAGGRFQMNGETIGTGAVLRVVNDHRKAADLDPLALVQVH